MVQKTELKYINAQLKIGLVGWRRVFLLYPSVKALLPEVERGRLVYRAKGSSKRFSYAQIKKGLQKQTVIITEEVPAWLTS